MRWQGKPQQYNDKLSNCITFYQNILSGTKRFSKPVSEPIWRWPVLSIRRSSIIIFSYSPEGVFAGVIIQLHLIGRILWRHRKYGQPSVPGHPPIWHKYLLLSIWRQYIFSPFSLPHKEVSLAQVCRLARCVSRTLCHIKWYFAVPDFNDPITIGWEN